MPVNVSPEYAHAEKKFDQAQTEEDKLFFLEEMIKNAPAHKGGEAMRANLRTRYKKFKERIETRKKNTGGGGGKQVFKKEDMQLVIAGLPNTGKTSLFNILTNQEALTSDVPFSTYQMNLGTTRYEDTQIQTIDMPPFPNEDKSTVYTTDTILVTINEISQIAESKKFLFRTPAKIVFVYTKMDLISEAEKRKIDATLKSKFKQDKVIFFSNKKHTQEELNNLKKIIYETFPVIRVYTKEPKKEASKMPMIMKKDSTMGDVAEKILKGMSKKIKRARIWGPSSKFSGQTIGIDKILKDKDVVEFQTD
ncbi:50S ribosome-binding GTPase [Candidatus Pacearchaeota archaeon]|nr:50S ribosome-binding GTPase [Candidatus Pacearchaeota archaeon]